LAAQRRLQWIDPSRPHWWVAEFPERYSVEQFASELDAAAAHLRDLPADHRIVYLADFSATVHSDSRNRAKVAEFLQRSNADVRQHVVAWGIVVSGAVLQGAVTAVKWLTGFPVPTSVFTSRRECEDWLAQQLVLDEMARANRKKVGLLG
jgi:hypothetical protein